jgi:DNA-binding transcriptional ArsR family regulator
MLARALRYDAGAMKRRLATAERAKAVKALADPTRVATADLLAAREHCARAKNTKRKRAARRR